MDKIKIQDIKDDVELFSKNQKDDKESKEIDLSNLPHFSEKQKIDALNNLIESEIVNVGQIIENIKK
ncbi:hypothetical protein BB559_000818 [Furculomyces boomerangus]|uniref:Uncharacterized protein n=2 Tax=Harpellales TaxID=61421 RepID=A0A2T9Z3Z0_9FUNG|nr:hypothetical protein BB559_000818 [Furculomyces boomerangus]PVZ99602.1 hypothetical protein BB558_004369 [Smittium angustum]